MLFETEEKVSRDQLIEETPAEIRKAADEMLGSPYLIEQIRQTFESIGIAGESDLALTIYLIGTSRLYKKPLAAIVQGASSTGKSFVIEQVARTFPDDALIQVTDMTPQSLHFMPEGALRHRFVVAGERRRQAGEDSHKAFREMLSAGELSKLIARPNPVTGEMETQIIRQKGPMAYVESTTVENIFGEDANRCILLRTTETPQQTRNIMLRMAEADDLSDDPVDREQTIRKMQTLQLLIEKRPVHIPYLRRLARLMPTEPVEVRRAYSNMRGMIAAIAMLQQRNRELQGDRIIAEPCDYVLAYRLLAEPISRALNGSAPDALIRFSKKLKEAMGDCVFTASQAALKTHFADRTVRDSLNALLELRTVEVVQQGRGPIGTTWRIGQGAKSIQPGNIVLPSPQAMFGETEMSADEGSADLNEVPF